jgi:DNA-binding MarR family transcriptional regulator
MTDQKSRSFMAADAAAIVSKVIQSRRRRRDYFSSELFADAAWDVLLKLFLAELEGRRLGAAELRNSLALPDSTSERWIAKLERDGWIRQSADVDFPVRRIVGLSGAGSRAMQSWLNAFAGQLAQARGDPVNDILERIERGRRQA